MAKILRRVRGNDYPIRATISKDGDFSLAGSTVKIKLQIGKNTVHTINGSILDAVNGKVEFIPTAESVADVGVGNYEILVHDGTYEATYALEDYEILQDVS